MIEGGGGAGFALEAFQRLRVAGQFIGEKLQRDLAAELAVLGAIDHAHPPAAEFVQDAIVPNNLANHAERLLRALKGLRKTPGARWVVCAEPS